MQEKRVKLTDTRNRKIVIDATMLIDDRGGVSLYDMAFSRAAAIDRLGSLGYKFLEHARKISEHPKDSSVLHWETEMCAWWNAAVQIKLKNTNDLVPMSLVREYLLDGYMIDFNGKADFILQLMASGNRRLSVMEFVHVVNNTILRGV